MTRRAELLALAARVEAATGADRELDAAVAVARHMLPEPYDGWPRFTASLDAAVSLVPGGMQWSVTRRLIGSEWVNTAQVWGIGARSKRDAQAATPALALTGAALRAMAEEADDE